MDKREIYIKQISPVFHKNGFWSVRVDDIASELGISKKTLYSYFDNKKDIIRMVIQKRFDTILEITENADKNNPNAVSALVEVLYNFYSIVNIDEDVKQFEDLKRYYAEIYDEHLIGMKKLIVEAISKNYIRGKKEGVYRNEFTPEFIGIYFATVYMGNRLGTNDEYQNLEELKTGSLKLLIYGISTIKGLKFLEESKLFDQLH